MRFGTAVMEERGYLLYGQYISHCLGGFFLGGGGHMGVGIQGKPGLQAGVKDSIGAVAKRPFVILSAAKNPIIPWFQRQIMGFFAAFSGSE